MRRARAAVAVAVVAAILAGPAAGQSVLERRYTSHKLDNFWERTLAPAPLETSLFEMLAPGGNSVEPVRPAPIIDLGVPFEGVLIGDSAADGGDGTRMAFPVIPLSRDEAGPMMRRLALTEIYLNRYEFYEPVSTDGAAVLETLTARQYAAALEAWLILARLYFAAPDLQQKCTRLTRLGEIGAGALDGVRAEALPQAWRPLLEIQQAAAERMEDSALTGIVCGVDPVRTRGEMVRIIESLVRARIVAEVRAKVEDTLTLLEQASTEFRALENEMDVLIRSAEIIDLERRLGNSAANIVLVKEDQLEASRTVADLQDVDLGRLDDPAALQDLETGRERMASVVGLVDAVLTALAAADEIAASQEIRDELAPCGALRGAYPQLDLGQDSATLIRTIREPYEDCIARIGRVVARFQEPTLGKALANALAGHVRQISETFLTSIAPEGPQ